MSLTIADYIIDRLASLGITECFGVPGDYAFPLDDAICSHKTLKWINSTNELNAAYAADGYARLRGMGMVCTTYGVGELSAINALSGSFAEHVVVFHLVGMPDGNEKDGIIQFHHSSGPFTSYMKMARLLSASAIIISKDNFRTEMEDVINAALKEQKPVYIGVPYSVAVSQIESIEASGGDIKEKHNLNSQQLYPPISSSEMKSDILSSITNRINSSKTCVIIPAKKVRRLGLVDAILRLSTSCNIPFFTFPQNKGALPETVETFMGCYFSQGVGENMKNFLHSVDVVIEIGDVIYTDLPLGNEPTLPFDPSRIIHLGMHNIRIGGKEMMIDDLGEILQSLISVIRVFDFKYPKGEFEYGKDCDVILNTLSEEEISDDLLARTLQCLLPPKTCLISDVGSTLSSLIRIRLNEGGDFICQAHYASIGWSIPATLGICLESHTNQNIIVTVVGDGAFQFTMNDIASYAKYKIHPIIIIIKNDGYRIERQIHKVKDSKDDYSYNEIQSVNYISLFKALGCSNWFMTNVTTHRMLVHAISHALKKSTEGGSLIVVNLKKY